MTKQKSLFIGALIFIALYLSPYYILGPDTRVRIHDNLDSNVVWYKLMADTGTLFSGPHSVVPNIMNGLPRNSLGSEFDICILLYAILTPFAAYTVNQTLMRFFAFLGMSFLLKRYIVKDTHYYWITIGVSLAFAFLPFWPSGGLSIAGLPLALFAFLNFKNHRQTKWDWVILLFLPFYSSFILSFSFFIGCIGIWWLIDWIHKKKVNGKWLWSIVVMTLLYLAVNYRIILEMFIQTGFASHREEFDRGHVDAQGALWRGLNYFIFGQTHVIRLTEYIVLPLILFVLIAAFIKRKKVTQLWFLFVLNAVFSLAIAFYYWQGLWVLKDSIGLIRTFNFGRIHFLEPLLWYISFAIALVFVCKTFRRGKGYVMLLLIAQVLLLFSFNEQFKYTYFNYPTFREFYSQGLFTEIRHYIGKDPSTYRVVSIGIEPSIAQYNGFYTLDGYVVSYPLRYKHHFRKIIAPELTKDAGLRSYFDKWGSRCYIFVDELGKHYRYTKNQHKVIHDLDLNTDVLKKMGGDYILSAVKILNAPENDLALQKRFENASSPWAIYLYKVL